MVCNSPELITYNPPKCRLCSRDTISSLQDTITSPEDCQRYVTSSPVHQIRSLCCSQLGVIMPDITVLCEVKWAVQQSIQTLPSQQESQDPALSRPRCLNLPTLSVCGTCYIGNSHFPVILRARGVSARIAFRTAIKSNPASHLLQLSTRSAVDILAPPTLPTVTRIGSPEKETAESINPGFYEAFDT